jgi:hypothetical protein
VGWSGADRTAEVGPSEPRLLPDVLGGYWRDDIGTRRRVDTAPGFQTTPLNYLGVEVGRGLAQVPTSERMRARTEEAETWRDIVFCGLNE